MYQRNVLASFNGYDEAHRAVQDLLRAGFGELQVRILPPPSANRRHQRRIVSAIVSSNHAHDAEAILARYGSVDLADDVGTSSRRALGADFRRDAWDANNRHTSRQRGVQTWDAPHLPWGAIVVGTVAVLSGWALLRGAPTWSENRKRDYAPGTPQGRRFLAGRFQSNMEDPAAFRPSANPKRESRRRPAAEADFAWGDNDAHDTAALHDRAEGSGSVQTGAQSRDPSRRQAAPTGLATTDSAAGQPGPAGLGFGGTAGSGDVEIGSVH